MIVGMLACLGSKMDIFAQARFLYFALMGVFLHNNSKINKDFALHESARVSSQAAVRRPPRASPARCSRSADREAVDRIALQHRTRAVCRLPGGSRARTRGH